MTRAMAAVLAACLGAMWSGSAFSQTSATRSSSFAYDAASGLLTQEVIEPGTPAFRLQTDYTYDTFGHMVSVTVSGASIVTRSSTTVYDARGQFATSATNALGQSETWQRDAHFGTPTSHTGPNGITTTLSYDGFGRKVLEVRADGTRTAWSYQFCNGVNGGTASCPAGAAHLVKATRLAADGATQNGPLGIVYFDRLDREVARDTQGFDGSTVRAEKQYDRFGRVLKQSRPYFLAGGTPQWTTFGYDALGRVATATQPDGSVTQNAYHGLTTSEINALNQTRTVVKNSQGQVVSVTDALNATMSYAYDPIGNLTTTTDTAGNVVSATYDTRGRKIASSDPNMGPWTYSYDALGQLTSQTDAKGQTTTLSYDKLGRMTQRVEPDMTSVWVYDTAANGIGKLAVTSIAAGADAGYQRSHTYDGLGRPSQIATTIGGTAYTTAAAYDANSRLTSVSYPSGFTVGYGYTSLGYANQLTNSATGQVYWTANTIDAEQHLTQQTSGNGVVTTRSFNPATGRLTTVLAGTGTTSGVQSFSYSYDLLGNPLSRTDDNSSLSESFTYDALNRLTSATVSQNVAPAKAFSYNAIGNLLSKSDVGTYTYPAAGQPRPHAVMSISGSTINTTFTYDPNGNQTEGLGRNVVYTSYNKPLSITQGSRTISFGHDTDHQRFRQVTPEGTTLYLGGFGVYAELIGAGGAAPQWKEYLTVGNVMVGMRVERSDDTVSTRYFHTDHLGSVAVITDENAAVVERLSYDAWGKRRFATGADDPTGSIASQTTRGFTGHEHLAEVGLVHMNGRVYDPLIARMMSADPTVPDAMNPQAWNRYSYVGNDPLAFTDPSGYSWLSSFFHNVGNSIRSLFERVPILRSIVQIAATIVGTVVCAGNVGCGIAAAAVVAGAVTGLAGGKLGDMLKAAAIAGATAAAMWGAGELTSLFPGTLTAAGGHGPLAFGSPAHVFNIASHAAVGCASAVASGGSCGSGAAASGAASFAGPLIGKAFPNPRGDIGHLAGGTAAHAVVGGLGSVAGGGKFANGAVTGAFGYLFNEVGDHLQRGAEPFYTRWKIATVAESKDGSMAWSYSVENGYYGRSDDKCNLNVYDVTTEAGASPGLPNGYIRSYPPVSAQWADPTYSIPGWRVLGPNETPAAGDVVAQRIPYSTATGHTAIVGPNNTVIGTVVPTGVVGIQAMPLTFTSRAGAGPMVFRRWDP